MSGRRILAGSRAPETDVHTSCFCCILGIVLALAVHGATASEPPPTDGLYQTVVEGRTQILFAKQWKDAELVVTRARSPLRRFVDRFVSRVHSVGVDSPVVEASDSTLGWAKRGARQGVDDQKRRAGR